jgi:alanyl-tRNA synthetase
MTPREIERVEELVNAGIRRDAAVGTFQTSYESARRSDVIAIFGEKYGDQVRVVDIGGFSKELCGGTHVCSSGQIGLFKIVSESSVAAGVRRIEAVCGEAAFRLFQKRERQIKEIAGLLKSDPDGIVQRVVELKQTQKKLKKTALKAREEEAGDISALSENKRKIKGVDILVTDIKGLPVTSMRNIADRLKREIQSGIILLAAEGGGKAHMVCAVTDDLVKKGIHAGTIIKRVAALVGGSGGGKPHMAQAGGPETAKLSLVLQKAPGIIEQLLG